MLSSYMLRRRIVFEEQVLSQNIAIVRNSIEHQKLEGVCDCVQGNNQDISHSAFNEGRRVLRQASETGKRSTLI